MAGHQHVELVVMVRGRHRPWIARLLRPMIPMFMAWHRWRGGPRDGQ